MKDLVADGGNSVTLNGSILKMESLPLGEVFALLERLDVLGIPWALSLDNTLIRYSPDERFERLVDDGFMETQICPGSECRKARNIYKVHIACIREEERRIDFGSLFAVRFSEACTFVEPDDKSRGIRFMMEQLQAPCSEVVVFGDGWNDLKMFQPEWFSVAMGNAVPPLKERADFVTRDSDADGILYACRHFGWVD